MKSDTRQIDLVYRDFDFNESNQEDIQHKAECETIAESLKSAETQIADFWNNYRMEVINDGDSEVYCKMSPKEMIADFVLWLQNQEDEE